MLEAIPPLGGIGRRRQLTELLTSEKNHLEIARERHVTTSIRRVIRTVQTQVDQLDKLISDQISSDDGLRAKDRILQSTPGVGPQTSAMLLAHLPELGTLNRQEVAALAGVAPWDLSRPWGGIGKAHVWGGRKEVRCVLYMAALTARRCNPTIRRLAQRLHDAGKPFKVVLTACMRKLLVILNTLIRNQTPWRHEIAPENP